MVKVFGVCNNCDSCNSETDVSAIGAGEEAPFTVVFLCHECRAELIEKLKELL